MALTFHRIHRDHPVQTDPEGAVVFRTPDGEELRFSGVSPDEVRAKAEEFLAWAS